MSSVISFNNQVYERRATDIVVDRTFKEFGQKDVEVGKTIEQFFQDYEDLFFQIPATGDVRSHQYLVERSSQLYKMEEAIVDVQPLLDEIVNLKAQSVADQQTILELNTRIAELSATANQV